MSILANSNAQGSSVNAINNSLRFQSASSQYLARTPSVAGNRQKFTFSFWAKRGALSASQEMYFVNAGGGTFSQFSWTAGNAITFASVTSSVADIEVVSAAVFRDPSAWYHVVLSVDTTQATALDRVKIYVNNTQLTYTTTTLPALNYNCQLNNTVTQNIGRPSTGTFDGYLANYHFIDGLALTPSSFAATDPITGQWEATGYSGSYGTNGFYLPFSNGTSTATLGVDFSGNNNNWNLINFTRSAGTSDCWMYDVPTNNTGPGVNAFQPASNYATFNSAISGTTNLINANLTRNGAVRTNVATIPCYSGKYYYEVTIQDALANGGVGVKQATAYPLEGYDTSKCATYFANGEYKIEGATQVSGFSTYTNGDVIAVAIDTTLATPKIWFAKNNTWQGTGNPTTAGYSLTSGLDYLFAVLHTSSASSTTASANFGQRSFAYTPPTGFKALCTANLPAATIAKGNQYMDATLYTGTAATLNVTNAGSFSPDLVWLKQRNVSGNQYWFDSVRGVFNYLFSDGTNAEASASNTLTAFNSNGFTLGTSNGPNPSGGSMVAWQWDAGSSTVTNTSGSISSQVRANTTAGFSIVTYTGTGANATVGHGLGVAPKMIICKNRTDVISWLIYHTSIGATKYLEFNTSAAVTATPAWNNTEPTSSVFTVGTYTNNNGNGKSQVAYCFAEIAGFSKFGSYTGNGSADGPFIYLGFRPKFIMIKRSDSTSDWFMYDTSRSPYNVGNQTLAANASTAEGSYASTNFFDFVSNGFKVRQDNASGYNNASGGTYIYMAFAESPFNISNAR